MSAQIAGPETVGHLTDQAPPPDPSSTKAKEIAGKSPMQIAFGRLVRDKIALFCAFVILVFVLVAVFAGVICSIFGVTTDTVFASEYVDGLTGMPLTGPPLHGFDPNHPFGLAPQTGEDNLAYWVYGCRTSLSIAFMATVFASSVGIVLGLLAGFLGGTTDRIISFFTDLFLTIPFLLAALVIAPIISERFAASDHYKQIQFWNLVAVLSIFTWMGTARLIRGEVLSLREREFIMAARVIGMPTRRILVKELLPNLAAPIVISISLMLPLFVAAEAGLAFLGIGVTSGISWGQTINKAVTFFDTYPLYLWEPTLGIVALCLALNLLGDAIRDALDPKTRR
ncbi:ABC transporter permease [Nocardioides taihuensis]|uniref:ABC transporter permease n=1 Tax=Nocardioides taihuensis TaxID=1835606 RepID=A0ABW0BQI7_9ACTN